MKAKQQSAGGGGIHLIGKSSNGKTTVLQVAESILSGPGYVRAWRATGTTNTPAETVEALHRPNDC